MGKDGGGGLGAYETVEYRREKVAIIKQVPDQIFLISAGTGYSYYDSDDWNCFFVTEESDAKRLVEDLQKEICRLHNEAEEFKRKKDEKDPEAFTDLYKTAAGKRYIKFLKDNGIRKNSEYLANDVVRLRYQAISKGK